MSRKIFEINKEAIGSRLKAVIKSHGIKQKEFAEKIGFSDKYISDVVKGRTKPSLALLLQIQSVFNVSMKWLVSGTDTPSKMGSETIVKEPPSIYYSTSETATKLEEKGKILLPLLSEVEILNICSHKTNINEIKAEGYCQFYRDWLTQPDETLCTCVKERGMEPLLKEGSIVALNTAIKDPSLLMGKICGIYVEGYGICFRWLKANEPYLVFAPQQEGYPIFCFPIEKNPILGGVEGAWVKF